MEMNRLGEIRILVALLSFLVTCAGASENARNGAGTQRRGFLVLFVMG